MESIEDNIKIKNADARIKEGQGLEFWAQGLLKAGLVNHSEYEEFLQKNNNKEEEMERYKLPQLLHYGFFHSIEEIKGKLSSKQKERFIIRCSSKTDGHIIRLIDTDLDGVCEFAKKLEGGFDKWNVEVKEFTETKIAGTIIIRPSGSLTIETWYGPHYLNTKNYLGERELKELYKLTDEEIAHTPEYKKLIPKYNAEFDPNNFDQHIRWRTMQSDNSKYSHFLKNIPDINEVQRYAIDVLRKIFPHLRPRQNEQIYIEYGVKPNGEIYFIEANDSVLLTGKK